MGLSRSLLPLEGERLDRTCCLAANRRHSTLAEEVFSCCLTPPPRTIAAFQMRTRSEGKAKIDSIPRNLGKHQSNKASNRGDPEIDVIYLSTLAQKTYGKSEKTKLRKKKQYQKEASSITSILFIAELPFSVASLFLQIQRSFAQNTPAFPSLRIFQNTIPNFQTSVLPQKLTRKSPGSHQPTRLNSGKDLVVEQEATVLLQDFTETLGPRELQHPAGSKIPGTQKKPTGKRTTRPMHLWLLEIFFLTHIFQEKLSDFAAFLSLSCFSIGFKVGVLLGYWALMFHLQSFGGKNREMAKEPKL